MKNKFKILCAGLLFTSITSAFSANILMPKDTLNRGSKKAYPIICDFTDRPVSGAAKFYISYNPNLLNILSVEKGLNGENCKIENNVIHSIENGSFEISIDKYSSNKIDTAFKITIEALVGKSNRAKLVFDSLYVDGIKIEELLSAQGEIYIPEYPIYETTPENIGTATNNPVNKENINDSRIQFSIKTDEKAAFLIYNSAGMLAVPKYEAPFKKGLNEIKLNTLIEDTEAFSGGAYYVIMETKNGKYQSSFVYIK